MRSRLLLLIAALGIVVGCSHMKQHVKDIAAQGENPSLPEAPIAPPEDLVGTWTGIIEAGVQARIRVVLNVQKNALGDYTCTLDSPDQGATGLSIDYFEVAGTGVSLKMVTLDASFSGTLSEDRTEIAGSWTQSGQTLPLVFKWKPGGIPPPVRPQEPKPPYPYAVEEITFENAVAGETFAGTLTTPEGEGPFPAVLLITGSGPQDRDESIYGHKPFLLLADTLTRAGVAVLRVDDRGVGGSTGSSSGDVDLMDFATDVQAGLHFLAKREDIDHTRTGLLGHSQGGLLAPMVAGLHPAGLHPSVAFLILLAPPGVNGEEIITLQTALIGGSSGADPVRLAAEMGRTRRLFQVIKGPTTEAEKAEAMRAIFREAKPDITEEEMNSALAPLMSQWYRSFINYNPVPALEAVRVPTLVLFGGHDLQVVPSQNEPPVRAALEKSGAPHRIGTLPNLNHFLQPATTGLPSEYGEIETTIDPSALTIITDWLMATVTPDGD